MSTIDPDTIAARKAAIEDELRERLERDRARSAPDEFLTSVALVCLECRSMNGADARFCTKCGVRFNALVVAAPQRTQAKA